MQTQRLTIISIALSTSAVALACLLQQQWPGLVSCMCIGILWIAAILGGRSWLASWCLSLMTLVTALAALFAAPAMLLVVGITLALMAYDLSLFQSRLALALEQHRTALERAHARRLLLLGALSLLVGGLALALRFNLSFVWLLLIGMGAILALAFVAQQATSNH